jgi:hypothetical protein
VIVKRACETGDPFLAMTAAPTQKASCALPASDPDPVADRDARTPISIDDWVCCA